MDNSVIGKQIRENRLTDANASLFELFIAPHTAPPKNGPISHPSAPNPAVISPSTIKGSNPNICVPNASTSWLLRTEMPAAVVVRDVVMLDARLYLRRAARRRKKEFQSRPLPLLEGEEGEVVVVEWGGRVEVEAWRHRSFGCGVRS
jgi:hypothetical protein